MQESKYATGGSPAASRPSTGNKDKYKVPDDRIRNAVYVKNLGVNLQKGILQTHVDKAKYIISLIDPNRIGGFTTGQKRIIELSRADLQQWEALNLTDTIALLEETYLLTRGSPDDELVSGGDPPNVPYIVDTVSDKNKVPTREPSPSPAGSSGRDRGKGQQKPESAVQGELPPRANPESRVALENKEPDAAACKFIGGKSPLFSPLRPIPKVTPGPNPSKMGTKSPGPEDLGKGQYKKDAATVLAIFELNHPLSDELTPTDIAAAKGTLFLCSSVDKERNQTQAERMVQESGAHSLELQAAISSFRRRIEIGEISQRFIRDRPEYRVDFEELLTQTKPYSVLGNYPKDYTSLPFVGTENDVTVNMMETRGSLRRAEGNHTRRLHEQSSPMDPPAQDSPFRPPEPLPFRSYAPQPPDQPPVHSSTDPVDPPNVSMRVPAKKDVPKHNMKGALPYRPQPYTGGSPLDPDSSSTESISSSTSRTTSEEEKRRAKKRRQRREKERKEKERKDELAQKEK